MHEIKQEKQMEESKTPNKSKAQQDRIERLKAVVREMPEEPGSYQFWDATDTIIYVGKAKKLKSRVASYFLKEVDRYKTEVLRSKIERITYTVVKTEEDALLLENNLIKQYQPKYNILLKDSKTYPSICVTKEPFPRIFKTRQIDRKSGTYFGPYSNIGTLKALLQIIKDLYHLRSCRHFLRQEDIAAGKYRPCLDYHIHACLGPCIGKETMEQYQDNVRQAVEILKGNVREVEQEVEMKMRLAARDLRFEEAEQWKRRLLALRNYQAKSEVVSRSTTNLGVFTILSDETTAFVNVLQVKDGAIRQAMTYEMRKKLGEHDDEILPLAIVEIRQRLGLKEREIVVEREIDLPLKDVWQTVPLRGDKRTLLELSKRNAMQYKADRLKRQETLNPEQKTTKKLKALQALLHLDGLPHVIECFDNSNISGEDAVAACVVFRDMKPSKRDYRKFLIRTVTGPDDYASMHEVVLRRYSRLVEERKPLPDLIIADGGEGQMSVIRDAVERTLGLKIPIAGLKKDDRHRTRELLFGTPPKTVQLDVKSDLFRTLTAIQDEVHRFAIVYHRSLRSKRQTKSRLDDIPGIGERTKTLLLRHFKSIKRIEEAPKDELRDVIGNARSEALWLSLHGEDNEKTAEIGENPAENGVNSAENA